MASATPGSRREPHDFEIAADACGRWIARDRDGMVGGVFRTRKAAIRFALAEAGGDSARIHILAAEGAAG